MSTHEMAGKQHSRAEERTLELAMEVASKSAAITREVVSNHSDLLSNELIELIIHRDYEAALQDVIKRREAGELNENQSQGVGLTAYLTSQGEEALSRLVSESEDDLSSIQVVADENRPGLFRMRLPDGIYGMGFGGCQFYGKAEVGSDSDWTVKESPFALGYTFIVRIEGDSGELWQNWNYSPDGSPKE